MDLKLLQDIIIIWGLAIVVLFIFHRLKIPTIIGLLLAGILAGPGVLKLISGAHEVELLAEIGVVLLLFTIGIEFSFRDLVRIRKTFLVGGSFQVLVTIAAIMLVARWNGNPWHESLFIGFLIALSSTAIVLRLLQDKGELDSPHGQTSLGILIFQDIIIVPMILLVPLLAGSPISSDGSILNVLLKIAGFVLFIFVSYKYILPKILLLVTRTQSRELFIITVLLIAFAIALLSYNIGFSLALGAFIAGLLISESEYSQQVLGDIVPFLYVFTSFFFLSIGMLLDLDFFLANPLKILFFTTVVLTIKTLIAVTASLLLGYPLRTAIKVGFTISQVGEFSFILASIGLKEHLVSGTNYQLFIAVSIMSMAATPFILKYIDRITLVLEKVPIPARLNRGFVPIAESKSTTLNNHIVIVGYGVNGRNVAKAADYADIPSTVIEINPDTVRKERKIGRDIHYGDASNNEVLSHAGLKDARVLVVTIPSTGDALRITKLARRMNPHLHIIIRARFINDMVSFYHAGADEVIPEEFETSVEIFTRALINYMIPHDEIEKLVARIRSDGYEMFRSLSFPANAEKLTPPEMHGQEIQAVHVCENAPVIGKKIAEIGFRESYQLSLLAVSRQSDVITEPGPDLVIREDDILFLLGHSEKLAGVNPIFKSPEGIRDEE